MKNNTFIYLWRSILDTSFYKNPLTCHLAIHLILSAAWKDHKIMVSGKEVLIRRGQIPTGRNKLSHETGMSPQNIRTCLKHLKNCGFLTIESTNQLSIITICKYNNYQAQQPTTQPTTQPTPNQRPTSDQPLQNKDNKDNKNNTYQKIYDFYVSEINPKQKSKTRALKNIERWHKKHSYDDLIQAIKNYQSVCNGRDSEHKKDPANFFGVNEVFHIDYLSENFIKTDTAPQAIQAGDTSIYDN